MRRSITASKKDFWVDMVRDVVGEAGWMRRADVGDGESSDDALLYPPPTHARCLAARRLFLTTCAIDSDRYSGVDVTDAS